MASALTVASVEGALQWALTQANTGFQPSKQGPDALATTVVYNTTTTNKIIAKKYPSIAASDTQDIDLQTDLDLLNTAAGMTKAVAFALSVTGNDVRITGHGANGLAAWFIRNSGELWITDGGFVIIGWTYAKAVTVDGTHKKLVITNSSGAAASVTLSVLGGA